MAGLHRARRREAAGMLAICAAVAAVVLLVPQLLDRGPAPAPAAPVTTPSSDADVLGQPTRGSLAGDGAYVDAVRALPWTEPGEADSGLADPAPQTRDVVFAGDVPGGRWALVAGRDPDLGPAGAVVVAWFVGPPGAAADQLVRASLAAGGEPGAPVALSDAVTGTLVVVGAPGDAVEISRRPDVAADGTIRRAWEAVEAPDGVAVVSLSPAAVVYDEALRYRVTRNGDVVAAAMPPGYRADVDRISPPEVSVTWLVRRPAGAADIDAVLAETAIDTLTRIGLSPADVPFAVLGGGDVPAPGDGRTTAHLLMALLPSGATYTEARLGREVDGRLVAGAWCGSELRPSGGLPPGDQVYAARCDVTDPDGSAETVSSLVVVAPSTAVRARALDADGGTLAEFDLIDGVAVVPAQDGAVTVQALAANGSTVDERPLMGLVDWDQE